MPVHSEMAASGALAPSSQRQPASQAQESATEGPSTACASSQAPCASEADATQLKTAFLGQNDVFDFTQPAGVSGIAFPRPRRPAPAQDVAREGPSAASWVPQTASAGEGAATRPKTTKSGKALAKTRWVEPQNVVAAAAAKAKMATSAPEPESAAATAQNSAEPWARMGGKRTKKVRPPCLLQTPLFFFSSLFPSPPLPFSALPSPPLLCLSFPSPPLPSSSLSLSKFLQHKCASVFLVHVVTTLRPGGRRGWLSAWHLVSPLHMSPAVPTTLISKYLLW